MFKEKVNKCSKLNFLSVSPSKLVMQQTITLVYVIGVGVNYLVDHWSSLMYQVDHWTK